VSLSLYAFAASKCRYSNDGSSWTDLSLYTRSMTWTLSAGEGNKYVYYNCQKSNGDDVGTASAMIKYSQIKPQPPSNMQIVINGGDSNTRNRNLRLSLYAVGATECRYEENDMGWGSWESYTTTRTFTVSATPGKKTIYYQCRNDYGQNTVYSYITLDSDKPARIGDLRATAGTSSISLRWSTPSQTGSGGLSYYKIYRDGSFIDTTTSNNYADYSVSPGVSYSYNVNAVDKSGNEGPDSNTANAMIKSTPVVNVMIISPQYGETIAPPAEVTFEADDTVYNTISCLYQVNRGSPSKKMTFSTNTYSHVTLGLNPSDRTSYTVQVTCQDSAGVGASSETVQFYVEPLVYIDRVERTTPAYEPPPEEG
jgi:hypothetical protein